MGAKKIFLDTNIVLDILDTSRVNSKDITLLLETLIINKYQIIISEDMLNTIFYINKNNLKTLAFFKVIQNRWSIVPFGKDVVRDAIDLALQKDLDLEDILQCLCAKNNGCEILITNDSKFDDCGVKTMTTKKFLNQ